MKLFVLTWFSFIWMFISLGPILSEQRSFREHLVRGVIGGIFAATFAVLVERRRRRKAESESESESEPEPESESESLPS